MSSRGHAGRLFGNGKYELVSRSGAGAGGSLWLGRHVALDRLVFVDILGQLNSAVWNAHERFLSEARAASLLKHGSSLRILDFGTDDGDHWLVMELVEGTTLAEVLASEGRLPARRAIAIATQVLAAISEPHEYGIIHRDLRPSNVLLMPWVDRVGRIDQVKLLDFGLAPLFSPPDEHHAPVASHGAIDPRSNVHAVGALLYQMLVGAAPTHRAESGAAAKDDAVIAPRVLNPAISPRLERLVLRALAEQFPSLGALRTALMLLPEACQLPSGPPPPRRTATSPGIPRPVVASSDAAPADAVAVAPLPPSVAVPASASAAPETEPTPAEVLQTTPAVVPPRKTWPLDEVPRRVWPAMTSAASQSMQVLQGVRTRHKRTFGRVGLAFAFVFVALGLTSSVSSGESARPRSEPVTLPSIQVRSVPSLQSVAVQLGDDVPVATRCEIAAPVAGHPDAPQAPAPSSRR